MGQPDVVDLVRAIEGAGTVDDALAIVGAEADHRHSGRAGAVRRTAGRPSARVQLAGAVSTIAVLRPAAVLEQLDTPGERAELARQITNAAKVLQAVMVGIERAGL